MDFEWSRGAVIGVGSFSTISLAHVRGQHHGPRLLPSVLAVKSAPLAHSALLRHEHSVLSDLQGCPHVVRCFGLEVAVDDATGAESCNLFLEYVSGGSLRDVVRRSCGGFLAEPSVRLYARLILRGLSFAHARGYAHCDIKPQNILVDSGGGGGDAKIADFGLAIKLSDNAGAAGGMRGTPLYMAPESAARGEYGAAADVWSSGCVVAEMASGRPPWRHSGDGDDAWENLLFRIGYGEEVPEVPSELSEEGKDFLRRCFVKDPAKRWTAEMLLRHPFMATEEEHINAASVEDLDQCGWTESSPRSVIALSQWVSPRSLFGSAEVAAPDSSFLPTPADRIKELAAAHRPNWSDDGCWINVRVPDANSLQEESSHETTKTKIDSNEDGKGRVDELMEFNSVESWGTVELAMPPLFLHHV